MYEADNEKDRSLSLLLLTFDWLSFLLSIKRMSQSICAVGRRRGRSHVVLQVAETLRVNTWNQAETDSERTTEHTRRHSLHFQTFTKWQYLLTHQMFDGKRQCFYQSTLSPQIIKKHSYMQLKRGAPSCIIYVPYLQILHGIYFLAWESGHIGGNLVQSPSLPRLGGWSGDPEKMGKGRNGWADVLKMT